MNEGIDGCVDQLRALIAAVPRDPARIRSTLANIPLVDRDTCADRALGVDEIPADDPALPPGCVPYLPCPVDALLRVVEHAPIVSSDVVVDVGSGIGRAAAIINLITNASVIGLEIQPELIASARALATRVALPGLSFIVGDAVQLTAMLSSATVFFLYCPFSGARLLALLAKLEVLSRTRSIVLCCVDLPIPACDWLEPVETIGLNVTIHRSISG